MNAPEQNLKSEIHRIANAYAKYHSVDEFYSVDYDQVPDSDKHKLAALCIETDDRDLVSIYENELDMPSLIMNALKSEDKEAMQEFAEAFKNKIAKYYEPRIIEKLDEAAQEIGGCDAA